MWYWNIWYMARNVCIWKQYYFYFFIYYVYGHTGLGNQFYFAICTNENKNIYVIIFYIFSADVTEEVNSYTIYMAKPHGQITTPNSLTIKSNICKYQFKKILQKLLLTITYHKYKNDCFTFDMAHTHKHRLFLIKVNKQKLKHNIKRTCLPT